MTNKFDTYFDSEDFILYDLLSIDSAADYETYYAYTLIYLDVNARYLDYLIDDVSYDNDFIWESLNKYITTATTLMYKSVEYDEFENAAQIKAQINELVPQWVEGFELDCIRLESQSVYTINCDIHSNTDKEYQSIELRNTWNTYN